jgi:large subunit ribosomal protein L3
VWGVRSWRNKVSDDLNCDIGLLGRKVGMTRIFMDDGNAVPVTVLDVSNNRVVQIKSDKTDNYCAVQVGFGFRKISRVLKPEAGHFAKASVVPCEILKEFRISSGSIQKYSLGQSLTLDSVFKLGQLLDVQGTSIGKGFSGTIKRHNFRSQRASHGNSRSHNVPGSISMAQDPGRVFPGKKMSGQRGNVTKTVQNLTLVRVDESRQLLFVRGAVPGAKNGYVVIHRSIKTKTQKGDLNAA